MSDFGLFLLLFVGILLSLGILRFLAWLTELQIEHGSLGRAGVNTIQKYVVARPRVMSRSEDSQPSDPLASAQTRPDQTADAQGSIVPSRDVMLNTFKALRKYGMPREEARQVLTSIGLPLDNNLWRDAAPVDDQTYKTPIVGRQTSAKFETDPDYPYQAPA